MAIGLSEFWTRLVQQEIVDAAGCKTIALAFANAHGGTPPQDASELAKFLVSAHRLSPFQARALLADSPMDLRLGSYRLRSNESPSPLTRWVEVERGDDLAHLLRTTAENPWLDAHAKINFATLQPIEMEPIEPYVGVVSHLPAGRCLDGILNESKAAWDPARVCHAGIALANGLSALHNVGLMHGGVRADRVWIADDGAAILLRDPAGPPVTGLGDTSGQWLDTTDAPQSYVAPELTADPSAASQCTAASDIYSLGCLLFRMRCGRLPFDSESVSATLRAHQTDSPSELIDAINQGESGDPMFRVLAYTMAKDPAARFASAEQLATALGAILPSLKSSPIPSNPPPAKELLVTETVNQLPPKKEKPVEKTSVSSKPATAPRAKKKATVKAAGKLTKEPSNAPEQMEPIPGKPAPIEPKSIEPETTSAESSPPQPVPEPAPVRTLRRRRRRNRKAPFVLTGLTVVVLVLMIALLVTDPTAPVARKSKPRPIPAVIPPVSNRSSTPRAETPERVSPGSKTENEDSASYQLVTDDRLLYAPPYRPDSENASLQLLPPGPAAIVSVKLKSIRDSAIGRGLIDALSPELTGLIDAMVARSHVDLDSIDRCTVALFPGDQGYPTVTLAVELTQPLPLADLLDRWDVSASQTRDGAEVYAGDELNADAFYLMPSEVANQMISRYAVGPLDRITEVASIEGESIPLARSLRTLWDSSSVDADLTMLTTPNFLFADGRAMLAESAPELVRPLKTALIPNVSAVLISADLSDGLVFTEARLTPSGGISEAMLMRDVRDSIESWPQWADQFIVESDPDASWRLLASRLPTMMRFVADGFRFGISDNTIVANTYLPAAPFSQVTLATMLAVNTPMGSAAATASKSAKPLSIDEILNRKMSVSFDQESLEFALDVIADGFSDKLPEGSTLPPIRLLGSDLQKMGITQNQQVRNFAKSDVPLRTVLTDLVLGANPDKTATGPADPKQALIWVVADDPDKPGQRAILVTTRQAASGRYELPSEFEAGD